MNASLVVSTIEWITESTSILVSALRRFPDGGISEIVTQGEAVRGDGLCDVGDTVEVDDGFSSRTIVFVWECGSSLVRSTTWADLKGPKQQGNQ